MDECVSPADFERCLERIAVLDAGLAVTKTGAQRLSGARAHHPPADDEVADDNVDPVDGDCQVEPVVRAGIVVAFGESCQPEIVDDRHSTTCPVSVFSIRASVI